MQGRGACVLLEVMGGERGTVPTALCTHALGNSELVLVSRPRTSRPLRSADILLGYALDDVICESESLVCGLISMFIQGLHRLL